MRDGHIPDCPRTPLAQMHLMWDLEGLAPSRSLRNSYAPSISGKGEGG